MKRNYPASDGDLKKDRFRPGASVSVDHFESRIKGRAFISFGQSTSKHYDVDFVFCRRHKWILTSGASIGVFVNRKIRAK